MTMAGSNCEVNIWRLSAQADDVVGGAMVSGTVVYWNVPARIQKDKVDQIFLAQGLETQRTFSAVVVPGTLDIREGDELQVVAPFDHIYYANKFSISSVTHSSHNKRDPRNYLMLNLFRSVRAHTY